jgi:hypothetical protein
VAAGDGVVGDDGRVRGVRLTDPDGEMEDVTEGRLRESLARLAAVAERFVVLEAAPGEYLQSAHPLDGRRRDVDRLILEHRDGATGRHLGTLPLRVDDALDGLIDYFRDGGGWRSRWSWIEMRLPPTLEPDRDDLGAASVEAVTPDDDEVVEEWIRVVDDDEVRGTSAIRLRDNAPWSWQVFVRAAEFIRSAPLEHELRAVVPLALRATPGVTDVREQDREVWIVTGAPTGPDLVAASGRAVDALAVRGRAFLEADRFHDG